MFHGIVMALGYANTSLLADNRTPLFCQPQHLTISVDQYIDMLEGWVREKNAGVVDNLPVAMAMLMALKEAFPCKGTQPPN